MTEKDASSAAATKKGKSPSKAKKPKSASTHPKVSEMVNTAIMSLKERGGSSLQAIKKYIAANYKADVEKLLPFIKKYLKAAVISGALVQTKGKGANGSFRMNSTAASGSAKSVSKAKKPAAKPKKASKATSTPKKTAKPKTGGHAVMKALKKSKPKKSPVKKSKPVAKKAAVKKVKPAKAAAKKKPTKASPKKKAAPKKARK